jgi:5-carboxymethyl-2-hydroxymuconate isomerase
MRIVRFERDGEERYGRLLDPSTIELGGLRLGDPLTGETVPTSQVRLLAPVAPSKIVCVGLNYRDHAIETGQQIPAAPIVFSKYPSSVIGDGDTIRIPSTMTKFADYEAELGVVIGSPAQSVSVEEALSHVFGYVCVNDVSGRDAQVADGQWVRSKSFDTFCPVGPWIVTADEIPDPGLLPISTTVNGVTLQDSSTAELIFGVAELISYISQSATLLPGDLLLTGTPSGVGFARDPKVRLAHGDTVSISIGSIGTLTNPVIEYELDGASR